MDSSPAEKEVSKFTVDILESLTEGREQLSRDFVMNILSWQSSPRKAFATGCKPGQFRARCCLVTQPI